MNILKEQINERCVRFSSYNARITFIASPIFEKANNIFFKQN